MLGESEQIKLLTHLHRLTAQETNTQLKQLSQLKASFHSNNDYSYLQTLQSGRQVMITNKLSVGIKKRKKKNTRSEKD